MEDAEAPKQTGRHWPLKSVPEANLGGKGLGSSMCVDCTDGNFVYHSILVLPAYSNSTQEAETGSLQVQGQFRLQSKTLS